MVLNVVNTNGNKKEINKVNEIPLFISIDQEGGRVNRMTSEILNLESANKISKKGILH